MTLIHRVPLCRTLVGLSAVAVLLCTGYTARAHRSPEAVEFQTVDGFTLHADLLAAPHADAPVAILLHMYHSNRRAWAPLLTKLGEKGFTVLAIDQRAHGESIHRGDEVVRVEQLSRQAFAKLVRAGPEDVRAAKRFLRKRGIAAKRLLLVGASYGCTVSLLSSGKEDEVGALVLLSPGTSYFGIDVVDAARGFRGPILAVAAEDDPRSAESARQIVAVHTGEDELVIYPSGGHGTRLFGPRPEVIDRVVEFLRKVSP